MRAVSAATGGAIGSGIHQRVEDARARFARTQVGFAVASPQPHTPPAVACRTATTRASFLHVG